MSDWHSWAAIAVFVGTYALIISEKVHRVAAALGGAGLMLAIGATDDVRRSTPRTPASTGTSSSCSWA